MLPLLYWLDREDVEFFLPQALQRSAWFRRKREFDQQMSWIATKERTLQHMWKDCADHTRYSWITSTSLLSIVNIDSTNEHGLRMDQVARLCHNDEAARAVESERFGRVYDEIRLVRPPDGLAINYLQLMPKELVLLLILYVNEH